MCQRHNERGRAHREKDGGLGFETVTALQVQPLVAVGTQRLIPQVQNPAAHDALRTDDGVQMKHPWRECELQSVTERIPATCARVDNPTNEMRNELLEQIGLLTS